jgi:signal transduction histidine kinase
MAPLAPTPVTFKRALLRATVLPGLVMVVLAILLLWQVNYLVTVTSRVERTDQVISHANQLQKLFLDMETGVRGYLLVGTPSFLDPYASAVEEIPDVFARLRDLVSDNDEQQARVEDIAAGHETWDALVRDALALKDNGGDYIAFIRTEAPRHEMDALRARIDAFVRTEERLRGDHVEAAQTATRMVFVTSAGLTILLGLVLAGLSRRELRRVSRVYETALSDHAAAEVRLEQLNADLERRILDRTAELSALNGELEAFSYSVSHDLRAPLRAVDGFSRILVEDFASNLPDEAREFLELVRSNAQHMGKLIEDLLAFSRLSRAPLHTQKVDMAALARRVLDDLKMDANGRHIEVAIGDLSPCQGDPALLRQVFANLLANAIKYTRSRDIAHVEIGSQSPEHEEVTFFVSDDGVGFDMTYAHKLFGVFQRLHRAEDFEGTGVGLAIVQRIVARHGGRVWAEGAVEKGATFYFSLPLEDTHDVAR